MDSNETFLWIIIITTIIVSVRGFLDEFFFNRYKFNINFILKNKQYERVFTSGFLHTDWSHLLLNMVAIYFFSPVLIDHVSNNLFIFIYFGSMLGGTLLSLYIKRDNPSHSAIGASGAISGIIYASITIDPYLKMIFFPIPIPLPSWFFAMIYLYYSVFCMRNSLGNISHSVHLGGAISGLLITLSIFPELFYINKLYIMFMLLPVVYWLFFEIKKR